MLQFYMLLLSLPMSLQIDIRRYGFWAGALMGMIVTLLFLPLWMALLLIPVGALVGSHIHGYCEG